MKQNIFLFILLGAIVVPAFCIYVYPWPNIVNDQETDIIKLHDDSVALIQDAIKKAKQQQDGIRVYGSGVNRQEQAEKDEIFLKEKLVQENKEYHEKLQKLHQYPLASGELIGLLGVYVALLGLHLHQIRL